MLSLPVEMDWNKEREYKPSGLRRGGDRRLVHDEACTDSGNGLRRHCLLDQQAVFPV